MAQAWAVRTVSGSIYELRELAGEWSLRATNQENPYSCPVDPSRWWPIQPPTPWPPEVLTPLVLLTQHTTAWAHPDRIPGGGKVTSPVVVCEPREGGCEPGEPYRPPCPVCSGLRGRWQTITVVVADLPSAPTVECGGITCDDCGHKFLTVDLPPAQPTVPAQEPSR